MSRRPQAALYLILWSISAAYRAGRARHFLFSTDSMRNIYLFSPIRRECPGFYHTMQAGPRPSTCLFHQPMFYRVVMNIINVILVIFLVGDKMGPKSVLPKRWLLFIIDICLSKFTFDNAPTPRIIQIILNQLPDAMHMVRKQDPGAYGKWVKLPAMDYCIP